MIRAKIYIIKNLQIIKNSKHMKKFTVLLISIVIMMTVTDGKAQNPAGKFMGMWTLDIEGGAVGWIGIHDDDGFVDADLLWRGGSVLPVSHVYFIDSKNMVATRTREIVKKKNNGEERKHVVTQLYEFQRDGNHLQGVMTAPSPNGLSVSKTKFAGWKLPDPSPAPDLSKVKYGSPVKLFNGKDIKNWSLVHPERVNGFEVVNGVLVNNPVQKGEKHIHYGNLRTNQEFYDFNLTIDVNVPEGSNSGIYLRGMYEVQVLDSYGKNLDSHNMGAIYSRITPSVSAEKPSGEWQTLDITLCDRHVTVILNGTKIIDNEPVYGPTGGAIIADVFKPGPIFLQGDHGKVSFRNIVLKPIIK
jgi:hypothetical protein